VSDIETPAQMLCHYADADAVDSFIAYRKKHKRATLTERGAALLAKTLAMINADGGDATEALDIAQERGWQTIKAEWYWRDKNGNGHHGPKAGVANTGDQQGYAAAGFARTPSGDCF